MLRLFRNRLSSKFINLGIILLISILILGLFAIKYSSALTFLIGILLLPFGWLLLGVIKRIIALPTRTKVFIFISVIVGFLAILSFSRHLSSLNSGRVFLGISLNVNQYQALINPANDSLNKFNLTEKLVFKYETDFDLKEKENRSTIAKQMTSSLLMNKDINNFILSNFPQFLKGDNILNLINKNIKLELESSLDSQKDGFAIQKVLFTPLSRISSLNKKNSNPLKVEIKKLPNGSFYRVEGQDKVEVIPFTRNETTVKFSIDEIDKEISFACFPVPYNYFSWLFSPLAGLSSIGNGFLMLLGLVSATIFTEVIKPVFMEKIKDWVKFPLKKQKTEEKPPDKAEEKELKTTEESQTNQSDEKK